MASLTEIKTGYLGFETNSKMVRCTVNVDSSFAPSDFVALMFGRSIVENHHKALEYVFYSYNEIRYSYACSVQ